MSEMGEASGVAEVLIVGGGAAGLASAVFCAEELGQNAKVVVLEGTRQCGTKILASGGGRCNVTHQKVRPEDFNGSKNIVRNVLAAFDAEAAVGWFAALGIELKVEETGKLYPVSDSAHTVVDALTRRCRELGVSIITNARVSAVAPPAEAGGSFVVKHSMGMHAARWVILATGGKSLPKSGSDGQGWELAAGLGHTVTSTHQALVPLVLNPPFPHAELSGLSAVVELSTFVGGKRVDHRKGSLLFTHFGISGPVVMDASRNWVLAADAGQSPELRLCVMPGDTFETVDAWLLKAMEQRPKAGVLTVVSERLPGRLAEACVKLAGVAPGTTMNQLGRDARRALVHALTGLALPVAGPRGWNYAEVTAGGVPLAEIDYRTMESRKVPGLYLVGEILDCDGRIGGFNFQWAWSTAKVAAVGIGRAKRGKG